MHLCTTFFCWLDKFLIFSFKIMQILYHAVTFTFLFLHVFKMLSHSSSLFSTNVINKSTFINISRVELAYMNVIEGVCQSGVINTLPYMGYWKYWADQATRRAEGIPSTIRIFKRRNTRSNLDRMEHGQI